ncbi:eukaryotic translation initiation factor 3 subunit D [Piptocephalis cylindrospora]|uniref:Eukaryotic translation initiation factor 3 subunit D n=1 Tax=Piptocephalis cylindrospora TaxID=1907219 RepID=A0A4P9Y6E6_9FUNG|nr:eukaryotic translation initiation factor 3 subunit D [Piptocephalis cylindrospora]|eukprot:RKP14575.1 eukaryotic translation initiation factor 3 subunit D [Piptocephalis cylindrospora]
MPSSDSQQDKPRFQLPQVNDHTDGWGPAASLLPTQFQGVPYAPFSKSDKLGRVADWTQPENREDNQRGGNRGRQNRHRDAPQAYGSGASSTFLYQPEEDESSFSVVDRSAPVRRTHASGTRGRGGRGGGRGGFQRLGGGSNQKTAGGAPSQSARGGGHYGGRGGGGRGGWRDRQQRTRNPSIKVGVDWDLLEEIEYSRLNKLAFDVAEGEDISTHGRLLPYDRTFDRVTTRLERPLQRRDRARYNVTTSEDPIIQGLAKEGKGKVFVTDSILSVLMSSSRSVYPWDIVITRENGKLFLDKRDDQGIFDAVHVNENAHDAPADGDSLNAVNGLSSEATAINEFLATQVLKETGEDGGALDLEHPHPFYSEQDADIPVASVGYRYRSFDLANGEEEDCQLIVRAEIDAISRTSSGNTAYVIVKALNEFDPKAVGSGNALDWRSKLDGQRGAVLATEFKNNGVKFARWAIQGILSGADQLKFGYVSRVSPSDASKHTILGMQTFKPRDLATQMNLSVSNGWGVAKTIVDLCLQLDDGKYILVKDPNRQVIRLYRLPSSEVPVNEEASEAEA